MTPKNSSELCYLIDGYNLLFSLKEPKASFQLQREAIIRTLQQKFSLLSLKGILIFDGSCNEDGNGEQKYSSPLEIRYTRKGKTADREIAEILAHSRHPKQWIVVTNDQTVRRESLSLGAKVAGTSEFLTSLEKRGRKKKMKRAAPQETKGEIERLRKIFEDLLTREEE